MASACSSTPSEPIAHAISIAAPIFAFALYARSVFESPAFGELADQGYHLELGRAFAQAWRAGEFPPTWSATANGGLGSPAFQLYPPLFAFLTAAWMGVAESDADALRSAFLTAAGFNLTAVYWSARAWLSPRRSLLAAGLSLLLPGATFVGLGRGMLPSFLAIGWAALATGAAERNSWPLLALAGTGIILTHTPTAYLVALTTLALVAVGRRRPPWRMLLGPLCALAATAWFWLPMLRIAAQAQTGYLLQSHPYGHSLWFASPAARTEFARDWLFLNEVATYVGLAQVLLGIALFLASRFRPLLVLVGCTLAASLWPTGEWLASLPGYATVQFSWRWQPLLSLACALAFASLPLRRAVRVTPLLAAVVLFFLPLAAPSDQAVGRSSAVASNLIEMRPLGATHELFPPGGPGRTESLTSGCWAIPIDLRPTRRLYHVSAVSRCRLRIYTYHFPAWRAWVDGSPVPIQREPDTALQLIETPMGLHVLEMVYGS